MGSRNATVIEEFILLGFAGRPQLEMVLFVVLSLIFSLTLFGNLSILALTCLDSRLHTPMYFFLSNLAFLNVCYTSAVVPKMLVNFLAARKSISYHFCMAQVYITLFLGAAECFLLMVMAFDRYAAICHPLHYTTTTMMNKTVCVSLAISAWVGSFLISVAPSFALKRSLCNLIIDHLFCEAPVLFQLACPGQDLSKNEAMMVTGSVFTLLLPLVMILLSYVRIVAAILSISSADGKRKAFSTCSAHVTVVTIYYGSGMFTYMRPQSSNSAEKDKLISLFYSVINPMLNPIIYSLRNKDVKEALLKVLGKTKGSQ
ncbi:PREDICTED: olfactory receptor 10-like [Gekko japonicus]|uniref:Olfactory receptor n=1 Tax=Gekko japonicus TaxID=146911 RepID=A0ABM1KBM6_GEKJA|nr:PREDICTED: olfactory receptor 10-like [Gekko japonicus]